MMSASETMSQLRFLGPAVDAGPWNVTLVTRITVIRPCLGAIWASIYLDVISECKYSGLIIVSY